MSDDFGIVRDALVRGDKDWKDADDALARIEARVEQTEREWDVYAAAIDLATVRLQEAADQALKREERRVADANPDPSADAGEERLAGWSPEIHAAELGSEGERLGADVPFEVRDGETRDDDELRFAMEDLKPKDYE